MSELKPYRSVTNPDGYHRMFSKKHYEFIADIFWQSYNDPEMISIKQLDSLFMRFVEAFEEDNPNFDDKKFLKAARSFQ